MNFLKNKWLGLAIFWLALMIYGLIFRETPHHSQPMFPHFDKVLHCLVFFCQFWLLARACWVAKRRIPYVILWLGAVLLAGATEWAQATLTQTRTADFWDGVADILGATIALILARHATQIWTGQRTEIKAK